MSRHKCTGEEDDAAVNEQFDGEGEKFDKKGKSLAYYDENSLYGSAVSLVYLPLATLKQTTARTALIQVGAPVMQLV